MKKIIAELRSIARELKKASYKACGCVPDAEDPKNRCRCGKNYCTPGCGCGCPYDKLPEKEKHVSPPGGVKSESTYWGSGEQPGVLKDPTSTGGTTEFTRSDFTTG